MEKNFISVEDLLYDMEELIKLRKDSMTSSYKKGERSLGAYYEGGVRALEVLREMIMDRVN